MFDKILLVVFLIFFDFDDVQLVDGQFGEGNNISVIFIVDRSCF